MVRRRCNHIYTKNVAFTDMLQTLSERGWAHVPCACLTLQSMVYPSTSMLAYYADVF